MFPFMQIESFYRSKVDGLWLDDEYPAVAGLCQEWLASLIPKSMGNLKVGDLKPAGHAMKAMKWQESDYPNSDRLHFALAMALSIPGKNTDALFAAYYDTLDQQSFEIGAHMEDINGKIQDHPKIDVYQAFSLLSGREYYSVARRIYMTELEHVRLQAVARDDVGVFKWTLPEETERASVVAYTAMLEFPVDPESAIYKGVVTDEVAEKALFRRQVSKLRHIATAMNDADTSEVYGFQRPLPAEIPVLEPFKENAFPRATAETFMHAHRKPDFAQKVMRDAFQVTGCFFDLMQNNLVGYCNAGYVQEVTQAFIDAGLSPSYLMSTGVCGDLEGDSPVTLKRALSHLANMGPRNWTFYGYLYQEFLKPYTTEEIIANCDDDRAIEALSQITGDRAYIENASGAALASICERDLGL
ncbi:hypothetical protein DV532_28535 (plasmid) [Pseudomonas sp. Leaf58]|nr:hypothetical protein DV532_28535 [Pseudomonas sp. Leaf58]KQN62235.1 hypothetical protein ASF02_08715 [Pseudomonas sp. Leaf58]